MLRLLLPLLVSAPAGAPAPVEPPTPPPSSAPAEPPAEPPSPAPTSAEARDDGSLPPAAERPSTPPAAAVPPAKPATATPAKPATATPAAGRERWQLNPPDRWYGLRLIAEAGFVGVARHGIQFGKQGSYVDMRREAGQDVLFPFFRVTGEFLIKGRHALTFLIQPLKLTSSDTLRRDLRVHDTVFPAGTPMAFKYDFGFYRFGYHYDFLKDPEQELAIGLALQLRNATIDFASRDGELLAANRNLGVVPLLRLRGRWTPARARGFWLGGEIDGAYIRGKVISGTRDYFVGALVDASVRLGFHVPRAGDVFVNVRYVGGGARGEDSTPDPGTDGYTENWLHTMALSLGLAIR